MSRPYRKTRGQAAKAPRAPRRKGPSRPPAGEEAHGRRGTFPGGGRTGPTVVMAGENPGARHIVDRDLRILAFNEAFKRWNTQLGLTTEVLGRPLAEVFPFLPPKVYEEYRQVLDHGQILISEETNMVGDREFVTETHKIPVFEGSAVTRVVTIVRDITARKAAERAVAQYQAQLKALASRLKVAEDRMRRRLAAELHDRINQDLAVSKLELQSLRASLRNEKARQSLDHAIDGLNHILQEAQLLTSELSYPFLGVVGLETAVAQYLKGIIEKRYGLVTEFQDDGQPKPLGEDLRSILFRDVRELLVNVVKHARARRVGVAICREGGQIRICVEDDGIGFEPGRISTGLYGGFGLLSIQEGLEQMGGHIAIQSSKDQGTRVILTAPLVPQAPLPTDED